MSMAEVDMLYGNEAKLCRLLQKAEVIIMAMDAELDGLKQANGIQSKQEEIAETMLAVE